jgi:tRNA-splicing endonuclease subunit Sen2
MATNVGPAGAGNRPARGGKGGGYSRFKVNNQKFGTPLPILLPTSPLHPSYVEPSPRFPVAGAPPTKPTSSGFSYLLRSYLSGPSSKAIHPVCTGTYDPLTRSVWVTNQEDREVLFERGFFGKGNLSRSDPSWAIRRAKQLEGERDGNG